MIAEVELSKFPKSVRFRLNRRSLTDAEFLILSELCKHFNNFVPRAAFGDEAIIALQNRGYDYAEELIREAMSRLPKLQLLQQLE